MFLAALPWAYWMAIPLLAATVLALVGFAAVYMKKVVEPHLLLQDVLAAGGQLAGYDDRPALPVVATGNTRHPLERSFR